VCVCDHRITQSCEPIWIKISGLAFFTLWTKALDIPHSCPREDPTEGQISDCHAV